LLAETTEKTKQAFIITQQASQSSFALPKLPHLLAKTNSKVETGGRG